MHPEATLPYEPGLLGKPRPLRAVFLNYLLDCLPAAALQWEGEQVRELHVRTCVGRIVTLADYPDLTPPQLRERGKSADPRAREELLEVYGLFASEYDYRPVDPNKLPYGRAALELFRPLTKRLLHSYGAIQCLEKLLSLLAEGGFILVNDYGQTQMTRDDEFEHQRFSLSAFVGVNFSLLRRYFSSTERGSKEWGPSKEWGQAPRVHGASPHSFEAPRVHGACPHSFEGCDYIEPPGEEGRGIHARLLGTRVDPDVRILPPRCSASPRSHLPRRGLIPRPRVAQRTLGRRVSSAWI